MGAPKNPYLWPRWPKILTLPLVQILGMVTIPAWSQSVLTFGQAKVSISGHPRQKSITVPRSIGPKKTKSVLHDFSPSFILGLKKKDKTLYCYLGRVFPV